MAASDFFVVRNGIVLATAFDERLIGFRPEQEFEPCHGARGTVVADQSVHRKGGRHCGDLLRQQTLNTALHAAETPVIVDTHSKLQIIGWIISGTNTSVSSGRQMRNAKGPGGRKRRKASVIRLEVCTTDRKIRAAKVREVTNVRASAHQSDARVPPVEVGATGIQGRCHRSTPQ